MKDRDATAMARAVMAGGRRAGPVAAAIMAVAVTACAPGPHPGHAYSNVRAAMAARSAYASVKDLREAQPLFADYASVHVSADLAPHTQNDEIAPAFIASMRLQVDASAETLDAPLSSCDPVEDCRGPVLVLNFREDAFDDHVVERVTMGDKLRGRLVFVDRDSGRIVTEKRIEGVQTYADILQVMRGSVVFGMLKSFPPDEDPNDTMEALERVPAIAPGQEALLATS